MVNLMIYSFIEIPFYEMIARIEYVKTVSVRANSEEEARKKLQNKHLIFSKKTPA